MEHDSQPEAYYVHVWIRGIHPMLWRRFLVLSVSTLADFHAVLQIGFDWTDFHLHRFRIRKKDYAVAGSAATMHGKSSWGTCAFASMNASCMSTISAIYGNTGCGSRNGWK
jgi:Plasmid pRiA4b ORF-3-like protein